MEIIPEIHLRQTFRSFVDGVCSDCNRVLDDKQLPDTEANRRDIHTNLVPCVVQNLVDSPYFREFREYVRVEHVEASGQVVHTVVQVKTDSGRICGWKCMDSTWERAILYLRDGQVVYDHQVSSPSVSSASYVQCASS